MKLDLRNLLEAAQAHAERGEEVQVSVKYFFLSDRDDARALTLDAGVPNGSEWTAGRASTGSTCWYTFEAKDDSGVKAEVTAFFREARDGA
jgi:hypothetical protein